MDIQRTITIVIEPDQDLQRTLEAFREIQQTLSEPCFNAGKPLHALALQRLMYQAVKGTLNAQMTISAIRMVAGAYASAKSNKKPAGRPFPRIAQRAKLKQRSTWKIAIDPHQNNGREMCR